MSTLPGNIPGLLRKGSPTVDGFVVIHCAQQGANTAWIASRSGSFIPEPLENILLDLDDPTGFHHALCWLAQDTGVPLRNLVWRYVPDVAQWELACCAGLTEQTLIRFAVPMPVDEVEALRTACLQKAGL